MIECLKKNKLLLFITVLFSVISSAAAVYIALFLQRIIDVTMSGDLVGFQKILLFCVLYLLAFGVVFYIYSLCSKILVRNLTKLLRKKVFHGIFKRNYHDFTKTNSADYISALTNDIKLIEENYILPLLLTLQHTVTFVVTLALLLVLSPLVTLCLVVCMAVMFLVPSLLGKALQGRQDALSNRLSGFTGKIKDMFSGYEVIKSFHVTKHVNEEFKQENKAVTDAKFAADRLFVLNEGISQMLAVFTQVVSIFVAAYLVITGDITMGTLIAIVQLGSSFVMPIVMIMQNMPKVKSIKPVLKRLEDLANYEDTSFTGTVSPTFEKDITLHHLNFAYEESQPVLCETNLTLQKNRKYAVIGSSGCGKTTLVKLLMGYYSNFSGTIAFDGINMRDLDMEALKQMIAVIHQNVYMFDKDIRQNICLYEEHPEADLDRALILSGVSKFLDQTPSGLSSPVGENGANLSGGQRQRIAIARAMIQKTPLLVLDEGTSAIDMKTAYDIESQLLGIDDLTLITITHKMSTELLGMYDQIIFMEEGRVSEMGTLNELLDSQGQFSRYFTMKN